MVRSQASLGVPYDLFESQSLQPKNTNSFWSSSYVYGSNDHQYLVLSHVLVSPFGNLGVYRASVLDINDTSSYEQFTTLFNSSSIWTSNATGLDYEFVDYGFKSLTSDPLGRLNTYSSVTDVLFNITFSLSPGIILNGGSGIFGWGECSPIL